MLKRKKLIAIVTGSGGSIGGEIVQALLQKGYVVYGLDIHNNITHPNFIYLEYDLRNYKDLETFLNKKITLGKYNTIVNCAGIREIKSIENLTLKIWEEVMAINLHSPFILSKTLGLSLIKDDLKGTIINIASVSGILGEPERTAYVSSKHAILGLTKQLAIEFGKFGIRVNSISPGVIRTNMTEKYFDDPNQIKVIKSGNYLNMIGVPEDISKTVLFLSSQDAKYVTGSNFVIDGGWTAGKNL